MAPQRELGARLRAVRKELGLTQQQVADAADMRQAYMAGIELGTSFASSITFSRSVPIATR